jgi:hypothetical protein
LQEDREAVIPYNTTTGVFTPPNGATNAFPGQIIASATWNAIFTDIANALTQVGQQQTVYAPRVITTAAAFTVGAIDRVILVDQAVGTIFLPSSATKLSPVTIIGNAPSVFGSGNAVLQPNGTETIDGLSSVTLTGNYQSVTLLPLSGGGWLVY